MVWNRCRHGTPQRAFPAARHVTRIVQRYCAGSVAHGSRRAQTVCAADLFPTPEFSNHPIPQTQTPAPRPSWHDYLDLAFLAAALAAASLLAVKGRSRTGLFLLSDRLAGLARVLAERLRLPDRRDPERHAGPLRQGLRGGRTGDCRLRAAAGVHALFRAIVLRLGLPVGGRAGARRRAARAGADVDRSCPGTAGLRLPRGGRAFCRDGLGVDHLPLRSVRRPVPPDLQRLDAGPQRGIPRRRAVYRPALLPLALPLRGDPCPVVAGIVAAPADSAPAVRAVPAVRRCLPLWRHPAADRCRCRPPSERRPGGG